MLAKLCIQVADNCQSKCLTTFCFLSKQSQGHHKHIYRHVYTDSCECFVVVNQYLNEIQNQFER